jgi:hypothetical protein
MGSNKSKIQQRNTLIFKLTILIFIWLSSICKVYSQSLPDTLLANPWIKLPVSGKMTDIELDEEGNIYLLETGKHRLHKWFSQGGYDSVMSIGGKGVGGEGLNKPSQISVTNRQALYCLDLLNRRLLVFNTNLKIVKEVNFLTLEQNNRLGDQGYQIWPIGFEVAPTGDLFLLNQEDNKILKVDVFGRLQTSFGGLDYGEGSLPEPVQIHMNEQNLLFVTDTNAQEVKVFDLFGIYKYTIRGKPEMRFKGIAVMGNNLLFYNDIDIIILNILNNRERKIEVQTGDSKIIDIEISQRILAILTENEVILYQI